MKRMVNSIRKIVGVSADHAACPHPPADQTNGHDIAALIRGRLDKALAGQNQAVRVLRKRGIEVRDAAEAALAAIEKAKRQSGARH